MPELCARALLTTPRGEVQQRRCCEASQSIIVMSSWCSTMSSLTTSTWGLWPLSALSSRTSGHVLRMVHYLQSFPCLCLARCCFVTSCAFYAHNWFSHMAQRLGLVFDSDAQRFGHWRLGHLFQLRPPHNMHHVPRWSLPQRHGPIQQRSFWRKMYVCEIQQLCQPWSVARLSVLTLTKKP